VETGAAPLQRPPCEEDLHDEQEGAQAEDEQVEGGEVVEVEVAGGHRQRGGDEGGDQQRHRAEDQRQHGLDQSAAQGRVLPSGFSPRRGWGSSSGTRRPCPRASRRAAACPARSAAWSPSCSPCPTPAGRRGQRRGRNARVNTFGTWTITPFL